MVTVRCESECICVSSAVISYTHKNEAALATSRLAPRVSRTHARTHARAVGTGERHEPTTSEGAWTPSTCPKPLLTFPFIRMRVFDFEHGAVGPDATQRERAERSGRALSRHVSAFTSTLLSRCASAPEISKPTCDSLWRSTTGSRVAIKKSDESQAPDGCAAQSSAARQRR